MKHLSITKNEDMDTLGEGELRARLENKIVTKTDCNRVSMT